MILEAKNVSYYYKSQRDKLILDHVSYGFECGKLYAILGPSGSGKTTLCNLIARFWDVESGTVLVGGQNVKDYTLEDLMDQISMVFQKVYLFADTVENNIKFGCPNATHEEVVAADNPPGDLRECCVAHGIFNIFSERFFVHPDACGNQDFLSGGNFVRINAEPSEKPEVLDIDAAAGELQFFKRHDALSLSV